MPGKVLGNECWTTLVCVDRRQDGDFSGRLYNPYLESGQTFRGLMDFLMKMEELLDRMSLPQSFTAKRSFGPPIEQEKPLNPELERRHGGEATFAVRVLFRQNASWQGSVTWEETGQTESFRSVLELLLLMDSAVPKGQLKSAKSGTRFSALCNKAK